jgi:hypothetical protein
MHGLNSAAWVAHHKAKVADKLELIKSQRTVLIEILPDESLIFLIIKLDENMPN